jgi:glucokinase
VTAPGPGRSPLPPSALTVGVDIGGTKVLGGVVDGEGQVLTQARRDTPADDVSKTLDLIVEVVEELMAAHPIAGVGIGAAGWIDVSRSTVLFAPNLAWRNEPLRYLLTERLGVTVTVENDGNAAAWAEFRFGAARAAETSMALFTVGTGIGGGIVLAGELARGAHGMAAEMGHVRVVPDGLACGCGRRGCLEQYASGNALVRFARGRAAAEPDQARVLLELAGGEITAVTGPVVTRAARAGDPVARAAFTEIGTWLGAGLADFVQLLDPEVLVVGGGVIDAGELLIAPAIAAYEKELAARGSQPVAPVVAARLGNTAGVVGAADLARR